MTAPQIAAVGRAMPSRLARARDVLAFEWTKLRSVRSNYWTLLIAAVVTLGVTAIVAQSIASAPAPPPGGPMNPLTSSFLGYGEYTVLPVTVLSVLTFTSEYASGLIRTTFTAVPKRGTVLAAKAAVTGAAALTAGELLAFASSSPPRRSCPPTTAAWPCPTPARCGPCWPGDSSWLSAPW